MEKLSSDQAKLALDIEDAFSEPQSSSYAKKLKAIPNKPGLLVLTTLDDKPRKSTHQSLTITQLVEKETRTAARRKCNVVVTGLHENKV